MAKKGPLSIFKKSIEEISTHDIFKREKIGQIWMRETAIKFLLIIYAGALICTFLIYFFQGFHYAGFNLEYRLLRWLGGATIGEIAVLAMLVYGSLFRRE